MVEPYPSLCGQTLPIWHRILFDQLLECASPQLLCLLLQTDICLGMWKLRIH